MKMCPVCGGLYANMALRCASGTCMEVNTPLVQLGHDDQPAAGGGPRLVMVWDGVWRCPRGVEAGMAYLAKLSDQRWVTCRATASEGYGVCLVDVEREGHIYKHGDMYEIWRVER